MTRPGPPDAAIQIFEYIVCEHSFIITRRCAIATHEPASRLGKSMRVPHKMHKRKRENNVASGYGTRSYRQNLLQKNCLCQE